MFKKILVTGAVVAGLVLMSTGCSSVSTEADEVALHYKGGSTSSSKFANCVPVAKRNYDGPGDGHYIYPDGQRTFSFTDATSENKEPIDVTTKDQQTVDVPGFLTFRLNTDCDTLRKFHETIGKKYQAYKDGKPNNQGWLDFLRDYIAVPLKNSMNSAGLEIPTWNALYSDAATQARFEKKVAELLPANIRKGLGGDFVTVGEVSIAKPKPPQALLDQLSAKEAARLANEAQAEKNRLQYTKYLGFAQCRQAGISEQGCITLNLAENGKITLWPIPTGQGVVVNPPGK
jgi:hypothetical protein